MTCPICDDDGWVDIPDEVTGGVFGARECPHLNDPGHAPFNANGLLDEGASPSPSPATTEPRRSADKAPIDRKDEESR